MVMMKEQTNRRWIAVIVIAIIALAGGGIVLWQISAGQKERNLYSVLQERLGGNIRSKQRAIRYIEDVKNPSLYPLLIGTLEDADNEVILLAKEVLYKRETGKQTAGLLAQVLLADKPPRVHQAVEDCLVEIGSAGIPALIKALDTKDEVVRTRLQTCLIRMARRNRTEIKEQLTKAFEGSNPARSVAAKEILYMMEEPPATQPTQPS